MSIYVFSETVEFTKPKVFREKKTPQQFRSKWNIYVMRLLVFCAAGKPFLRFMRIKLSVFMHGNALQNHEYSLGQVDFDASLIESRKKKKKK